MNRDIEFTYSIEILAKDITDDIAASIDSLKLSRHRQLGRDETYCFHYKIGIMDSLTNLPIVVKLFKKLGKPIPRSELICLYDRLEELQTIVVKAMDNSRDSYFK